MRSLFASLLGFVLTPGGLFLLAIIDSSLVFFMPLGLDVVVIIMAARSPDRFWAYALIATVGAVIGSLVTYWIGLKIGEHGLTRLVDESRLKRIERSVTERAAASIGALALVPPPFPLTLFVVTSGALRVAPWPFFGAFTAAKAVRFGAEAGLAARYGGRILSWMESTVFEVIVGTLVVVILAGTIASAIALLKRTRRRPPSGAGAAGR